MSFRFLRQESFKCHARLHIRSKVNKILSLTQPFSFQVEKKVSLRPWQNNMSLSSNHSTFKESKSFSRINLSSSLFSFNMSNEMKLARYKRLYREINVKKIQNSPLHFCWINMTTFIGLCKKKEIRAEQGQFICESMRMSCDIGWGMKLNLGENVS